MRDDETRGGNAADAPLAVAAGAYLSALNQLFPNLQPILLGALAASYGFGDAVLGQASAAFIGFNTLCILSAPLWVRRVDWRLFSVLGCGAGALALFAGVWMTTFPLILGLFALLGLLKALSGAPAFTSLGDSADPGRTYGIALIAQSLLAAAAAFPLSAWIVPRFGLPGVLVTMALIFLTGPVAALWLPKGGQPRREDGHVVPLAPLLSLAAAPPLVSLLALGCFVGGIVGFWFFAERIGAARGASPGVIGTTISLCAFATIASAAAAAWASTRLPGLAVILAGTLIALLGFGVLQFAGDPAYVAAVFLFSAGYGLAQPVYWAITRQVDATGRLFVAAPAAGGAAGVLIGLAAGALIARAGYDGLIVCCGVLFVIGWVLVALAVLLHAGMRRLAAA